MDFKKGSYWLRSGIYSMFEKFSLQIFRFGGFYMIARELAKDQAGVWFLFLAINAFVEVARIGLIQNALMKFLASSDKSEHGKINTASLVLNVLLTSFSLIILIVLSQIYHLFWEGLPLLDSMLFWYLLTTSILIPFFQFNFIQQGNLDFKGTFWSNFAREGLFFVYIGICFFTSLGMEMIQMAQFQVVAAIMGSVVSYFTTKKAFFRFSRKVSMEWVKKLFNYGKYVFGTSMSSMLIKNIDKFMLAGIIGPAAVSIYEVAIKVANLVEVPTQAIAAIVFPQSAQKMEQEGKGAVKYLYERSVGIILALIVPAILFVLVFPEFVLRIVAPTYMDTVPILQVTMLFGLFIPFARQFGTMLDSIGKPKVNFYFVILGAVLNVIFNYLFIKSFGVIGAAYGTLSTYMVIFALNQIILYKELGVQPLNALIYAQRFYVESVGIVVGFFKTKLSRS